MLSLRTMRRPSTGVFQTDVRTVLPSHITSWGRPTLTESNRDIRYLVEDEDPAAVFWPIEVPAAVARLSHPWKREKSPAFHASRSPGVLRSQSGRISLVTARRSCQRSTTDGRPQNQ